MIIAIVPIKYVSTRIPGKNYRKMDGKPLYWYIFNTLTQITQIDKIICNTDSSEIEKMITNDFPNVEIYYRPKHLEGGDISTNLLLLDTIQTLNLTNKNNLFIQTHVTNPLLSVETINKCIQTYIDNSCDSLFTVKKLQTRLYDKLKHAINHDPNNLIPTQDLDPIYEENSCLYIFSYEVIKNVNRIGKNPYLFIMNDIESSDIDYETDFILTEQLIKIEKKSIRKVVLVTGNSGGIGSSIVDYFHKKNWIVIGIDLIYKNNVDKFFQFDLTKNNNFESCIDSIIKEYGRIDCLVNNAALQICKSWEDYNENDWNNTFNCNLKSCYELSKNCRNCLKKTKGSIINICSVHSLTTSKNIGLYSISKSALQGLTKSMSLEYIEDGINVNCILPGAIQTPMLQKSIEKREKALEKLKKSTPFGDIGDPKEIAKAVYFLYKSNFSVGSSLVVDGGASIKLSTE